MQDVKVTDQSAGYLNIDVACEAGRALYLRHPDGTVEYMGFVSNPDYLSVLEELPAVKLR